MRRSSLLVMAMVMTLTMSMTTAAFAERYDEEDALDTDTVEVDVEELDVSVAFVDVGDGPDNGPIEAAAGVPVNVGVETTNNSANTTLAEGWNLGLEVEMFEDIDDENWQDAFELEHCNIPGDDCNSLEDLVTIIDLNGTQVIQVEGLPEDEEIGPGDPPDMQFFRATFHEPGNFTGTVFVFGEPA